MKDLLKKKIYLEKIIAIEDDLKQKEIFQDQLKIVIDDIKKESGK